MGPKCGMCNSKWANATGESGRNGMQLTMVYKSEVTATGQGVCCRGLQNAQGRGAVFRYLPLATRAVDGQDANGLVFPEGNAALLLRSLVAE